MTTNNPRIDSEFWKPSTAETDRLANTVKLFNKFRADALAQALMPDISWFEMPDDEVQAALDQAAAIRAEDPRLEKLIIDGVYGPDPWRFACPRGDDCPGNPRHGNYGLYCEYDHGPAPDVRLRARTVEEARAILAKIDRASTPKRGTVTNVHQA